MSDFTLLGKPVIGLAVSSAKRRKLVGASRWCLGSAHVRYRTAPSGLAEEYSVESWNWDRDRKLDYQLS